MRTQQLALRIFGTPMRHYVAVAKPNTKRMYCIAAIYAKLTDCSPTARETLIALNRSMQLSKDIKPMVFPMLMANQVPVDKSQIDTQNRTKTLDYLLKIIPEWMRYSDINEIRKDFERLLDFIMGFCPKLRY